MREITDTIKASALLWSAQTLESLSTHEVTDYRLSTRFDERWEFEISRSRNPGVIEVDIRDLQAEQRENKSMTLYIPDFMLLEWGKLRAREPYAEELGHP